MPYGMLYSRVSVLAFFLSGQSKLYLRYGNFLTRRERSIAASLTHGLPTSTHQRYSSRDAAMSAYLSAHKIEELEMGQPYYYRTGAGVITQLYI